jgi:hypothetical protein
MASQEENCHAEDTSPPTPEAELAFHSAVEAPPLLPVPSDVSSQGDELCETCKALNLDTRRFVVQPGDKEWMQPNQPDSIGISLGNVEDIASKASCPFCRLVLQALGGENVPTHEEGEPVCVDLSWSTDGPQPDPRAPWSHVPEIRILRPYARKLSGGFLCSTRLNLFPEITLLANDSPTPSTTYLVRPIRREKIDFAVARRWLDLCKAHHEGCRVNPVLKEQGRSHPADEVPNFRCVDVVQNCLVKPGRDSQYTALSYVWGRRHFFKTLKSNVKKLEQPHGLENPEYWDEIPLTVKDAMQATREMGLKYLWVDSLCIVQDDDTGRKDEAMGKMYLIYGTADLVLIAASGPDAYAGLSGVRPGSRGLRQPIEEIASGFRLAFKARWQDSIEGVAYYTRGWT